MNNLDELIFSDPVTLDEFKDPRFIIECGHTIDRQSLLELKTNRCPICNVVFSGDPNKFPINWIVVKALNLTIPNENIYQYDIESANRDHDLFVDFQSKKKLAECLEQIGKYIKNGVAEIPIYLECKNKLVREKVITLLKQKGFNIIEDKKEDLHYCIYKSNK